MKFLIILSRFSINTGAREVDLEVESYLFDLPDLDHPILNWNLFREHDFSDADIKPPTHNFFYDMALQHELRSEVNSLVRAGMETNQLEFRMTEPFDPIKYK